MTTTARDREPILFTVNFGQEPYRFVYLPTHWFALLQFLCVGGYIAFVFVDFGPTIVTIDSYRFKSAIHVAVFVVLGFFNRATAFYQNRARKSGYLGFFLKTRRIFNVPFFISTMGNAAIVILSGLWPRGEVLHGFQVIHALQIIVCVEVAGIAPCLIIYAVLVWRHNHKREAPDAQIELSHGFHDDASERGGRSEIIEKQAEMIRYLRDQKQKLSKQILELRAEVENNNIRRMADGFVLDAEQLLSSKESEIRSLKADRDKLASTIEALNRERAMQSPNPSAIRNSQEFVRMSQMVAERAEDIKRLQSLLHAEREVSARLSDDLAATKRRYQEILLKTTR
eukprot:TRINITY_DN14472_c0_g1_i1.p1 TRINITY_DN14472_c0_g1~~TRINITY_DN14472_c0_g1_i1.p1  ORF type:complete len:341 (+),score=81.31 TRINITY_DN14472_c0_g1_i1:1142-2164(+)